MANVYPKPFNTISFSMESVEAAAKAVNEDNVPLRVAAMEYKIARSTLRRYLGRVKRPRPPVNDGRLNFTPEHRKIVCEKVLKFVDICYPMTIENIRGIVYDYCETNNLKHNLIKDNKKAGYRWLLAVINSNPALKMHLITGSAHMHPNRLSISDYYPKMESLMDTLDIKDKPECIYNVMARDFIFNNAENESVMMLSCSNAAGEIMLPIMIFNNEKLQQQWPEQLPPRCASLLVSNFGRLSTEVFNEFLKHFLNYRSNPNANIVLIFDCVTFQLNATSLETGCCAKINLICQPERKLNNILPLDILYNKLQLVWWDRISLLDVKSPEKLAGVLNEAWNETATKETIKESFEKSGVFPFKPKITAEPIEYSRNSPVEELEVAPDLYPSIT